MVNEGILIPKEVEEVIISGIEGILAGDTSSQAAKLLQLEQIALTIAYGNTLKVDEGVVIMINKRLSPAIISATLMAGCKPVNYYEKTIVNGSPKPTARVIKTYLAVSHANKDNPSDVKDMTWLDRANAVGMAEDTDNIYFLGEPIINPEVTILRDNPVTPVIDNEPPTPVT